MSPVTIFNMPITEDGVVIVDRKQLVDAAEHKHACASPALPEGTTCAAAAPAPPATASAPNSMPELLKALQQAIDEEKATGQVAINAVDQTPESTARLSARVQALLSAYTSSNSGDWQRYAMFNDIHYVRNLVESNDDFELIVLCWSRGQVSRVHNHANAHCWLAVLDGEMRETQFQRAPAPPGCPAPDAEDAERDGSTVYVEPTKVSDMRVGDAGYINDSLALHNVGCYMPALAPGEQGPRGGVTLHCYAPPIRRVKIYEDSKVTERVPGYYSKGGERV
ncbi:hypothetical protein HYH02_000231 [Chlamydomonas schloesseri]|uniref:Cysteine dioxygenase n=1 Tax=Chlamydomonas schloesseri TaxID=2026947 RepID=A0A836B7Y6_9CHLO|nr:hypothetical protein HYH02_000231 [Chlamydomonas schloesseri]|eukprot:KAG2450128.1 hypothetical protein HYH02_000231 [Chlamydomonas schloesseri]